MLKEHAWKTWKRCESCWHGGNLKNKLAEKNLSGSQIQPSGPLIKQEVTEPLWEPKGCRGYHPCHGPNGPGQLCEGERKSKMKRDWRPTVERTKRRRRRDLKAAGKCCAWALRWPTVFLNWRKAHLQPPAGKKAKQREKCVFWEMDPLFLFWLWFRLCQSWVFLLLMKH